MTLSDVSIAESASSVRALSANTKRVHVETWGCQMNIADSEKMLSLLAEKNYVLAESAEDADLVLLNTCHIREKARHKVVSRLGVLKELKALKPGMTIAVAGCVAQAEGKRLLDQVPEIDVLFGPGKIDELPKLLDEHAQTRKKAFAVGFHRGRHDETHQEVRRAADIQGNLEAATLNPPPTVSGQREVSRFVNIQQGCNNYCTFCVVPFTRGREVSRLPRDILADVEAMVRGGAKEVTVLGQNVNSYGHDLQAEDAKSGLTPFVQLLKQVARVPGLQRLRFTTSNPHDFTPDLARLFLEEPKLGRYLHLPLQSGSDRTLARMKRKVTAAEYLERVQWLRSLVPDMAISTDLIVGFPGETDADFAETLKIVKTVNFSFAFTFKYSPRKNTPASRYEDQVAEEVKERRLAALNSLQDAMTIRHHQAEIGLIRPVLFQYQSRKSPGYYYGRTEHFRLVRVASDRDLTGELRSVRVTHANKTALLGDLI